MRLSRWLFVAAISTVPWGVIASDPRTLSLADRVRAQEAIERVYYNHRIWPKENPQPKPPFEEMVPKAVIEAKVTDYLKKCAALDKYWQRPIQPEQLQAEMDRMAKQTKDPAMLKELFAALGNDPTLVAECLARPVLADRLVRNWYPSIGRPRQGQSSNTGSFERWWTAERVALASRLTPPQGDEGYAIPSIGNSAAEQGQPSWEHSTLNDVLDGRTYHSAVWTGAEMIVWGGGWYNDYQDIYYSTGSRYSPSTDTWTAVSNGPNCPTQTYWHSAVWTGSEMIVWGGRTKDWLTNAGARYDPTTDTWRPVSTGANCPSPRQPGSLFWTGKEMLVWGGYGLWGGNGPYVNTGGLYDPQTDTWRSTSTGTGCPAAGESPARSYSVWTGTELILWGHIEDYSAPVSILNRYDPDTDAWAEIIPPAEVPAVLPGGVAVWTGTEMIVWGGSAYYDGTGHATNEGSCYNPLTGAWRRTSTGANCPPPGGGGAYVGLWAGSEMIVWGGYRDYEPSNQGSRYDPLVDTWTAMSTGAGCPPPRQGATAVWTGSEMILWGGECYNENWCGSTYTNTGARYSPASDSWVPTSLGPSVPVRRSGHTAVWTGAEMIVWGGPQVQGWTYDPTGGRYIPALDAWSPTSEGTSCPDGRLWHTAIWTGQEMIIWGGYNMLTDHIDVAGGRYDPALDTWSPVPDTLPGLAGQYGHTAVWTGTEMIVWGGLAGISDECIQEGGRYSPGADTWIRTSAGENCPGARVNHTAVWTGTDMIIWGGEDDYGYGGPGQSGARYDPPTDSWRTLAASQGAPSPRFAHTAVWTGSEMIVWGGTGDQPYLNDGARYNPVSEIWTPTSTGQDCPIPRGGFTALWTGHEMLVWGGSWSQDNGQSFTFSMEQTGARYDPAGDLWKPIPIERNTPSGRDSHTAVWTGSKMIVWGGEWITATGGIYSPPSPPAVATMRKAGSPFRILVQGSNLQSGMQISINGSPWSNVSWKNAGKVVIKGGADLKTAVPKGVDTVFTFTNPDGGQASVTWHW